jgi:uncharacterized protein YjbI with pentapeptide repeats
MAADSSPTPDPLSSTNRLSPEEAAFLDGSFTSNNVTRPNLTSTGTAATVAGTSAGNGSFPIASHHRDAAPKRRDVRPVSLANTAFTSDGWQLLLALICVGVLILASMWRLDWLVLLASGMALLLAVPLLWPMLRPWLIRGVNHPILQAVLASVVVVIGLIAVLNYTGSSRWLGQWIGPVNWDAVGALAEGFGAAGQILVALLAAYVAWRQYVISLELTTQQNRITQQQTIDTYFQGISDLILDEEGLLEDWPPERAIAEGRTAAILSGLDAEGKAKILRFLSSSKLLTPLKRDRRLGRAIFDGMGGYEEDVEFGVRVIQLGGMLAGSSLANTDLRWTELSEANFVGANLQNCDLTRANLSRSILHGADLTGADLSRARLFHGSLETASPRDRINPPNYHTGAQTGAVIENADFTNVQGLSEEQRYYCCAWGGAQTRSTVPGGCEGIPNLLE